MCARVSGRNEPVYTDAFSVLFVYVYVYIYLYIYLRVRVCVCVCVFSQLPIVAIMAEKKKKERWKKQERDEKERMATKRNWFLYLRVNDFLSLYTRCYILRENMKKTYEWFDIAYFKEKTGGTIYLDVFFISHD